LLDTGDRILEVNQEFTRVFGYANEEACGHLIQELIVPEELLTEVEEYARRAVEGESLNYETLRKRKDGTRVHVSVISGPVSVADSHISHYIIYRDITERKRAEQRLRESEAYLAEAQRLSQTGSWAWNPATGDIRYCSEMCCRVLGFDHAGSPPRFEELFQRLHPDDQAASRERFEKGIRDKADFEWDYRIVHPEKGIRDIHAVGHAVLDGSGNLSEYVGTVMDVTERKRGEKKLQRSESYLSEAQKLSHTGTAGWDIASREIYWSQETFRIYELDPTTKVTSELIAQRTHPQDRSAVQEAFERALREQTEFDLEHRILMSDGSIKYLHVRGLPQLTIRAA
jgi:PAS domain S-box-containing protein